MTKFTSLTLMKLSLLLIILLAIYPINESYSEVTLPALGESSYYQLQQEQAIGKKYFQKLQKSPYLVKDPLINFYLNEILQSLLQGLDRQYRDYHLSLIANKTVNAFAVPGGYLGLYSGLIFLTEDESQLAGVLAHEIAHVSLRHGMQLMQKNQNLNVATLASLFLAIAVSSQYDGQDSAELTEALVFTGVAGSSQAMINFTRDNEYEADRKALDIMSSAGYPKIGVAEFFAKIEGDGAYGEVQSIEFLRTHPVSENRMGEAYQFLRKNNLKRKRISSDYQFFKVYLNYLLKGANQIESTNSKVKQFQNALSLLIENKTDEAIHQLELLYKFDPSNLWVVNVLMSLANQNLEYKVVLNYVNGALGYYPSHGFLLQKKIDALISLERYKEALHLSKEHENNLDELTYLKLLQKIYTKSGEELKAKEIEAEYHLVMLNYERALYLYRYLNAFTKTPHKKEVYRAKIKQINRLVNQQKAEKNKESLE